MSTTVGFIFWSMISQAVPTLYYRLYAKCVPMARQNIKYISSHLQAWQIILLMFWGSGSTFRIKRIMVICIELKQTAAIFKNCIEIICQSYFELMSNKALSAEMLKAPYSYCGGYFCRNGRVRLGHHQTVGGRIVSRPAICSAQIVR